MNERVAEALGRVTGEAFSPRQNPRGIRWRVQCRLMLSLVISAGLTSSCALWRLKQDVKQMNAHGVVTARITPVSETPPTYALAWSRATTSGTNDIVGFQRVRSEGTAVFLLLLKRTYNVGAFTDLNGNGHYDLNEPMDYENDIQPAALEDADVRPVTVSLQLSATNRLPFGRSTTLPRDNPELGEALPLTIGQVADLKDPKFSVEVGEAGMWKPYEFLRNHGLGVYFMEPFDPKKVPVLFVYGISGSPQDWSSALKALDQEKFQAWFFQYPSGIRLDKSANALAASMFLLKQRYAFRQMAVVAHSMGGLVSRGAMQRVTRKTGTNFIYEFITVSTPWGGHTAAEMGVKHLEFPVPSWRDMVPGSDYLQEILSQPLPSGTRHDLIFGYKHSGGLGLPPDNDGVVGVESELLLPVQEQAASVFGFHLNHDEILHDPAVLRRIERMLSQ